jgi:molecular chaperone DnaJ
MRNPYEVLEIKEGSTKEEIKSAYRELVKKYHPDQYGNNPLQDLAEEKMREINEAYDYLMKNTTGEFSNSSGVYATVRRDIQNGNLKLAEESLNKLSNRDAEWNFLMGVIHVQKGWHDSGYSYLQNACQSDPSNMEYREAFNRMNNMNNSYRQGYRNRGNGNDDMCDFCIKLWCLENLCDCFCSSGC